MKHYIDLCLNEAEKCYQHGDVPVGAVVVCNGEVVGIGHNTREQDSDVIGHAEINAIKAASRMLKRWNLTDCCLYVTLKPCSMCASVIKQSRIEHVFYLLDKLDYKKDYDKTIFEKIDNQLYSESEQMYSTILSDFFRKKR